MTSLLVVEDEQHLADGLRFNLQAEGYAVEVLGDGESALARLEERRDFDAVLLDVMLPGINGFEVAATLRQRGHYLPILMLTARSRPEDVLKGFESGADDYLPKPFELRILLARLHGLLRRRNWQNGVSGAAPAAEAIERFQFSGKTIDFERLEIRHGEQSFRLTTMEAELLRFLVKNADKPVSRKQILEQVWGLREDTDTRAIDNFIVRLRRYLEVEPSRPRHLVTVRGVGYQFVPEPKESRRTGR